MRKANVKVVAKDLSFNASRDEIDRNQRNLLSAFRQAVNKAGIMKTVKKYEFYESKSKKLRKKKMEKMANLMKLKFNQMFPESGSRNTKPKKRDS
jgi:ribosomal protein S21